MNWTRLRVITIVGLVLTLCAVGHAVTVGAADAQPFNTPAQATSEPPSSAPNQPASAATIRMSDELARDVQRLPLQLQRLTHAAERLVNDPLGLTATQADIEALRTDISTTLGNLAPIGPRIEAQIARLGPPPKDGERDESDEIKAERAKLNTALTDIEGATKRLQLTDERAAQLLARVQGRRRALVTRDLLSRASEPLVPAIGRAVSDDGRTALRQFQTVIGTWFDQLAASGLIVLLLIVLTGILYGGLVHVRDAWVQRRFESLGTSDDDEPLSFLRRTKIAAFIAPAFAAPRLIAGVFLTVCVVALDLTNWQITPILAALLTVFATYVVVAALARAVLLPAQPRMRLVGVDSVSAARISLIVHLLTLVWGIDHVVVASGQALSLPDSVVITSALLINLAFATLLVVLINTPVERAEATEGGRLLGRILSWLQIPTYATAIGVVVASMLGYLALGRFVMSQVMLLATGGLAVFLIHRAIAAVTSFDDEPEVAAASATASGSWLEAVRGPRVARPLAWILNGLMFLIAVPILLLSWGFSSADIAGWTRTLIFGFEVGQVHISPARILLAIAIFVGLILATRLIQRWMKTSWLAPQRVDPGLAHSIHQFMGYAGVALAVLAAISYAGLDVTNIAIIAGALSVGIGFGLQSIVNNFVSGLILLVERPIKVGDWIVVGDHQGHVRRISVRSTEIETFDRASLILPNSELISGTVQNWTHRNTLGRVVVPVGASYDANPDQVIAILREVAENCPSVLQHPAPFIAFEGLGASSLDFTVRAYIPNVNSMLSAKTEILLGVVKAFRDADIEIPFPQQDIHL
ncbi:MAG: mechanosensitive ion channel domain-containing protein, partial [Pseudomonadota bacterium]